MRGVALSKTAREEIKRLQPLQGNVVRRLQRFGTLSLMQQLVLTRLADRAPGLRESTELLRALDLESVDSLPTEDLASLPIGHPELARLRSGLLDALSLVPSGVDPAADEAAGDIWSFGCVLVSLAWHARDDARRERRRARGHTRRNRNSDGWRCGVRR